MSIKRVWDGGRTHERERIKRKEKRDAGFVAGDHSLHSGDHRIYSGNPKRGDDVECDAVSDLHGSHAAGLDSAFGTENFKAPGGACSDFVRPVCVPNMVFAAR